MKLQFEADIPASIENTWDLLWKDENYRRWTSAFTEGSHALSDWKEGSRITFLDGKGMGMYGVIEKMQRPHVMVFKHQGEIKNGEEKEAPWAGALESYYLTGNGDTTHLRVEMDANEEMKGYFEQTFPKALRLLKDMAEGGEVNSQK